MDSRVRVYEERVEKRGVITMQVVLPEDDGGTGDRWSAEWAPAEGALPDHDSSARTFEEAIIYLAYGLAEEVLELRAKLADV